MVVGHTYLVDLGVERFTQREVHHRLEALDARGIRPVRHQQTPDDVLAWMDQTLGGFASSLARGGGTYLAEDASGRRVACAAFDVRNASLFWLKNWPAKSGAGVLGPFGVDAEATPEPEILATLLEGSLFSLRERGYRQALVPALGGDDAAVIRELGGREVERVDFRRGGRRYRTAVLASGNGSNFQSVIDGVEAGTHPLDLQGLVVNRPDALARFRASDAGVPHQAVVWDRGAESREAYDARLLDAVAKLEPELVLLLGWMHVVSPAFVARFPQLLNVHPAFLPLDPAADRVTMPDGTVIPAFRGARAVDEALAAGSAWIGASVHRVNVAVDRGEVLARAPLRLADEPRADLDRRLHSREHAVLESAIRRWFFEQP